QEAVDIMYNNRHSKYAEATHVKKTLPSSASAAKTNSCFTFLFFTCKPWTAGWLKRLLLTYKTIKRSVKAKIVYACPMATTIQAVPLSRAMPQNIGIERRRLSNEGVRPASFQ